LLTTLHREFLRNCRQAQRFAHVDVTAADQEEELPHVAPEVVEQMDGRAVLQALRQVDEVFRAPLALYYLEEMTYKEIADTLEVPAGTVMSRLARGKAQLRHLLCVEEDERRQRVMELRPRVAARERVHG
jgi:RNA polymerase sigma factor (sigma-70 family)